MEAEARAAAAVNDMDAAREQMSGLETELKEEREHAESLGELANERREHMTKLQEQVEEAEERYAEANWRLGKSLYFERIVKRRKGLDRQAARSAARQDEGQRRARRPASTGCAPSRPRPR